MASTEVTLLGRIQTLEQILATSHHLSQSDVQFAEGLIQAYHKYGGLTGKQEPWVATLIEKASKGVPSPKLVFQDVTTIGDQMKTVVIVGTGDWAEGSSVPVPAVGDLISIVSLFDKAKAHLKRPKITLTCQGKPVVLSLGGHKAKYPGSIFVIGKGQYPTREYYGRITPTGEWICAVKTSNETMLAWLSQLDTFLHTFATNPSQGASEFGGLTGSCCFCGKTLGLGEDKRSVTVGYGPVCANHFGLTKEWLAAAEAPTYAKVVPALHSSATLIQGPATMYAGSTAIPVGEASLEVVLEDSTSMKAVLGGIEKAQLLSNPIVCYLCEVGQAKYVHDHGHAICEICEQEWNA